MRIDKTVTLLTRISLALKRVITALTIKTTLYKNEESKRVHGEKRWIERRDEKREQSRPIRAPRQGDLRLIRRSRLAEAARTDTRAQHHGHEPRELRLQPQGIKSPEQDSKFKWFSAVEEDGAIDAGPCF
ncbi:hypothetical protein KM043_002186 [Ampulex compressa]|nr:hypothetical protein KM043_002186 [Ampulex compressa]